MAHDSALDAHEHAEHAEHAAHENDPFISRVSITIAILAVLAAAVSSLENIEEAGAINAGSEAVLAQDQATDLWNEYQADSLKKHVYGIAADAGGPKAAKYAQTAKDQTTKQDDVRKEAKAKEDERERDMKASDVHEHRHHWLTGAATMVEIGIAISTVAIITRKRAFWLGSIVLGVVGVALLGVSYLM